MIFYFNLLIENIGRQKIYGAYKNIFIKYFRLFR